MAKQEALPSGTVGTWPSSPGTAKRTTLWPAVSPSSVSSGSRKVGGRAGAWQQQSPVNPSDSMGVTPPRTVREPGAVAV